MYFCSVGSLDWEPNRGIESLLNGELQFQRSAILLKLNGQCNYNRFVVISLYRDITLFSLQIRELIF